MVGFEPAEEATAEGAARGAIDEGLERGLVVEVVEAVETLDFLTGAFELACCEGGAIDKRLVEDVGLVGPLGSPPILDGRGPGFGALEIDCLEAVGLVGEAIDFVGEGTGFAGGGAGWAITLLMPAGLTKRPCPRGQSKYRSPLTEPSFFPVASGSSIPRNWPGAALISPM